MTVYEVVFITKHHYNNGCMIRDEDSTMRILAKDGEEAVRKARKKIAHIESTLESLKRILDDVG